MGPGEKWNVLWIIAFGTNRSPPRTATVVGLAPAATSIDRARSRAAPKATVNFRISPPPSFRPLGTVGRYATVLCGRWIPGLRPAGHVGGGREPECRSPATWE